MAAVDLCALVIVVALIPINLRYEKNSDADVLRLVNLENTIVPGLLAVGAKRSRQLAQSAAAQFVRVLQPLDVVGI